MEVQVGGAERGQRKRRQQAAAAVQSARSATEQQGGAGWRRFLLAGAVIVVLLGVVVGVGVYLQQQPDPEDLPPSIPLAEPAAEFSTTVEDGVITAGDPAAPLTIDIYEDFLCPGCGQFEEIYGERIERAIADQQALVRFHPVAILDRASQPPGYSSLAAAASVCAAQHDIFPAYHRSLFNAQPVEGGPGWTQPQLIQLGRDLGAGEDFASCTRGIETEQVDAWTQRASGEVAPLRPSGRFSTPTVLVDGELVDLSQPGWLADALAGGSG